MDKYIQALLTSIGIFLSGYILSYIYVSLSGVNPLTIIRTIIESPPAQATLMRVETASSTVETLAETLTGRPLHLLSTDFKIVSVGLGILFTNSVTALGSALTPLIPLIWFRNVTPRFMKLLRKDWSRELAWGNYYRYAVPLAPVSVLAFSGFMLNLVVNLVGGFIDFMAPEMAGIISLSAVGVKASLNSKTPEELEESYNGFWRVAFYSILFLIIGAFMEARLIV